jgi:hypothetical protein
MQGILHVILPAVCEIRHNSLRISQTGLYIKQFGNYSGTLTAHPAQFSGASDAKGKKDAKIFFQKREFGSTELRKAAKNCLKLGELGIYLASWR